jgi:enoyl-CoA hydratase
MIEFTVREGVGVITLNDPTRRNAMSDRMIEDLDHVLERIETDGSIGAVVIGGAGESFCAGARRELLSAVAENPASPHLATRTGAIYAAVARFGQLPVPTVAAVRGAAVGAGLNLALAADVRILSPDARLLSGFLRIGLHPGGGHFGLVLRALGSQGAAAMALFGQEINGMQAAQLGLAWEVTDEVDERAFDMARAAAKDPELVRALTSTFRLTEAGTGMSWPAAIEVERAAQNWSLRRRHERQEHGAPR